MLSLPVNASLSPDYYRRSCPSLQQILSDAITAKQIANPTTASSSTTASSPAATPRSSSPLLPPSPSPSATPTSTSPCPGTPLMPSSEPKQRSSEPARARSPAPTSSPWPPAASSPCWAAPPTPSPSAARTPSPPVLLTPTPSSPTPTCPPLGFSHCKEFAPRIYNYHNKGWGVVDPRLDAQFAKVLQRACAIYLKDPTLSTFNDVITPGRFDNVYYQNLQRGFGLLASDSVLMSDPRTRPYVLHYASNQTVFFQDFAQVMTKLSLYGVKTGRDGEVRRRCDSFNNI